MNVDELLKGFDELLSQKVSWILEETLSLTDNFNDVLDNFGVQIPQGTEINYTVEDLADLVRRSSAAYEAAARMSGVVRAKYKIAEGRYKAKYKSNLIGKNTAEREREASAAARAEYNELVLVESLLELTGSVESAARIGSESARKLLDKVTDSYKGHLRGEHAARYVTE